ncbi:MAG TPA: M28 family peptidase [Saprospiraceae bacterium]|nr:M28 family peptidase [Saprospiraceae bacterium]
MKNTRLIFFLIQLIVLPIKAQTNFNLSDPFCLELLKGNFSTDSFSTRPIVSNKSLNYFLNQNLNKDSIEYFLKGIVSFQNRNTVNDFNDKPNQGIRGARNWIKAHLDKWSMLPGADLFTCEFEFDYLMCNRTRHSQLLSIIPGNGPLRKELVIVEAHLDSRCEILCDTLCLAEGADDNGSGSALLIEIARNLCQVNLSRTIVILWVTGEEQGLGGSRSFASFCKINSIPVKAVFNNDIVGGIECGKTSSPPSCPGPFQYDSTRLRIFSSGVTNSMSKNLARLTRLIMDYTSKDTSFSLPKIDVMFGEDRSGRGSDHIPFREQGYSAIRLTSSYEHGDGNPNQPDYSDRQHSSRDILGKDFNGDGILDSLYVNFNYLKNNGLVNAISAVNAASSTLNTYILQLTAGVNTLKVIIENPQDAVEYIIGIRKINSAYFDTIIFSNTPEILISGLNPSLYYVTATGKDTNGWIGMFGQEYSTRVLSKSNNLTLLPPVELMQNRPNPFDELTLIPIVINDLQFVKSANLEIHNEMGDLIKVIKLDLKSGLNEIFYDYQWNNYQSGNYFYTLKINGNIYSTKKMILSNF